MLKLKYFLAVVVEFIRNVTRKYHVSTLLEIISLFRDEG